VDKLVGNKTVDFFSPVEVMTLNDAFFKLLLYARELEIKVFNEDFFDLLFLNFIQLFEGCFVKMQTQL
jgi:hypothetical protein